MTNERERIEALPNEPAAYWRPDVNLSEVYGLQPDGRWHYNITGSYINADEVPDGLVLLGRYANRKDPS